jgi:hypothetical protein
MTDPPQPPDLPRFGDERERRREASERWREAGYPSQVVEKLDWKRRYSIIRIGASEFAFSRHDAYVAGLQAAWAARIVPEHGPSSIMGIDLPEVARSLRGVDIDLSSTDQSEPRSTSGDRD